jgi:hypothetical protein
MVTYRFELPADKGPRRCSIRFITLKETGGAEEDMAKLSADAKGKHGSVTVETIRASIVAVDDKPVAQPYGAMDTWNSRTRRLISEYWNSINGVDEGEAESFINAATPVLVESRPALSAVASHGEDG